MKTLGAIAKRTLLGSGVLLLALGLMIWAGLGGGLIVVVHIALGVVLVLSLWTLAAMAARSGVSTWSVALAALWGLLVLAYGMAQGRILPGEWHWTVQVAHVFISMGAIWWGRRLGQLMRREARSPPRPVLCLTVSSRHQRSTRRADSCRPSKTRLLRSWK